MRAYGIRLVGLAGVLLNPSGGLPAPAGSYLSRYDPEAHGGMGEAEWAPDPESALCFENAGAAMECWRQVPLSRPMRNDGRPNRPLTAYTVEVAALP